MKKRRKKPTGKGHLRERDGWWYVVIDLGPGAERRGKDGQPILDKHGKPKRTRRQEWHRFATEAEAIAKLNEIRHKQDIGRHVEPTRMTVEQLLERWLPVARGKWRPKTAERNEEIIRHHLIPALGSRPLQALTADDIDRYYTEARQSGRRDGKGGLAERTLLHHHRLLSGAMKRAVKWKLIPANPVADAETPKPADKEPRALDERGVAALLDALKGSRLLRLAQLAVATGLRRGELLALRWKEDVDLDAGKLTVRRSLEQTKAGGVRFADAKTKRSRRTISIGADTIALLRQYRADQKRARLLLGRPYAEHDLVFCKRDGAPIQPDEISKAFRLAVVKAGVGPLRFHDLRHTAASLMLKAGISPRVVADRLGHSTPAFTLTVYGHTLPGQDADAANRLEAALRAGRTTKAK